MKHEVEWLKQRWREAKWYIYVHNAELTALGLTTAAVCTYFYVFG